LEQQGAAGHHPRHALACMKKKHERATGDVGIHNLKEVDCGHRRKQLDLAGLPVKVAEQAGVQDCLADKPA